MRDEIVYATVKRVVLGGGYAFAREVEQGDKRGDIFIPFAAGRKVEQRGREPWFTMECEEASLKVDDKLVMKIFKGDRGWRARFWGLDASWAAPNAIEAFYAFLRRRIDDDQYRSLVETQKDERELRVIVEIIRAYVSERIKVLVDNIPDQNERRYWTALASIEFAQFWANRLERPIDFSEERARLSWADKPERTTHPVESIVRRIMELRDAGKPASAEYEQREAVNNEREKVDRFMDKMLGRVWEHGGDGMRIARYRKPILDGEYRRAECAAEESIATPVWDAFGGWQKQGKHDRALAYLDHTCFSARCEMARALQETIEAVGRAEIDEEIPFLWNAAHEKDPHFTMCGGNFTDLLIELLDAGRYETLRAIRNVLTGDAYRDDREMIDANWPQEMPSGQFDRIVERMQHYLENECAEHALDLYKKYVVEIGHREEELFLADSDRTYLLAELRKAKPVHDLMFQCSVVANQGDGADELITRFKAADEHVKAHHEWPEALAQLVWALTCAGRLKEASHELEAAVSAYPGKKEEWDRLRREFDRRDS